MRIAAFAVLAPLALGTAARAADQPGAARVLGYSGIFQDNYVDVVVNPSQAATGKGAQYVPGDSSAAMLGNLRTQKDSPQLDVVIMDTTTAALACAEGLTEKLTPANMPVLEQLHPLARSAGGGCAPGVTFDHFVMVYDSQQVVPAPTSWKAMWDKKWAGKVALSAPPDIQGLALTAILAQANGGAWDKPDGAFRALKELAPSVQTFSPQPDGYSMVLNGIVDFATGWNARAQYYHDKSGGRLGVLLPSEGTVFQINTINLVKGAPHRDAALAFIGYALGATAQKAFTERMFYAPTNTTAQVSQAALDRTAASPANQAKVIPIDWSEMIKLRDNWNQRWRREVIAAGGK